jgi:hypothetical protein
MKSVLLFLAIVGFFTTSFAQVDTAAVLKKLLANKQFYVGKQVSLLTQNLPLPIKYHNAPLPFPQLQDTLSISQIDFSVVSLKDAVTNSPLRKRNKSQHIVIYLAPPLLIPKKLFKRGYILDAAKQKWTINHELYFGKAIVADFKIYDY